MKIKNFICSTLIGLIIMGLMVMIFTSVPYNKEISMPIDQNQIHIPNEYNAASISKGTILLLLAAGVIGVLGISRKTKDIGSPDQRNGASIGSIDTEHQGLNEDKQKIIV